MRVARGGAILAFDRPDRRVTPFIDARDATQWIIAGIEEGRTGTFNVGGRPVITIGEVLETCRAVSGAGDTTFVWVSEAFLLKHSVRWWTELPLWLPQERDYLVGLDSTKAVAAGLRLRPLAETIRDILAWERTRPLSVDRQAGLALDREAGLLQQWQAAQAKRRK